MILRKHLSEKKKYKLRLVISSSQNIFPIMNNDFNKNEDALKMAWSNVRQKLEVIYEGGGKKARKNRGRKEEILRRC